MDPDKQLSTLGGHFDGLLRSYAVLEDKTLALVPDTLTFVEASTLPTAALTAWNALYGGTERIMPGDVVLTQGTGGVSLFAAQFALAAGATVIATTSSKSSSKTEVLKRLGVQHIINYTLDTTWGVTARSMTPGGKGVDFVVDIGGAATLEQSLQALRYEGTLAVVGFLSGMMDGLGPGLLSTLIRAVTVRGILGGSMLQFEDMNRAVKGQGIKPVVDEKSFSFAEVREAYQYLADQRHVGKVVIRFE